MALQVAGVNTEVLSIFCSTHNSFIETCTGCIHRTTAQEGKVDVSPACFLKFYKKDIPAMTEPTEGMFDLMTTDTSSAPMVAASLLGQVKASVYRAQVANL